MMDANQWLRAYVAENSEEAFTRLVEQHIALVYATARRMVCGDEALAKDISQMVFTDLARKARGLPPNVVLSGWLYRHTTFTASKMLRGEARRREREREAASMNGVEDANPTFEQLTPLLDGAIGSLSARDRDAVVMRYFDSRHYESVASSLELTKDAAQKRVSRALKKLRRYFERRGVTVSTAMLGAVLAAQSTTAVPASLAGVLAGNALAHVGAAATPIAITLLMAKLKTIAVGAIVIAATTTPLILQHNAISRLRVENVRLRQKVAAEIRDQAAAAAPEETDNRELLQLRAEVARLRREQANVARIEAENKKLRADSRVQPASPATPQEAVPSEAWADRGFASPMDALQTAHWAIRNANIEKFKESILITDQAREKLHGLIAKMAAKAPPEEATKILNEVAARGWDAEEGLLFPMIAQNQKHGYKSYRVLNENITHPDEQQITIQLEMNTAPPQTRQFRFKQFGNAWKQVIDIADLPPEARN
jgi:RNA polymerase sigma factor (sigma-70 family)